MCVYEHEQEMINNNNDVCAKWRISGYEPLQLFNATIDLRLVGREALV